MNKVWSKPEIAEEDVGMEVTSYESADIEIVI
jgi:coenzyme PQQ precursor peptide PqqA